MTEVQRSQYLGIALRVIGLFMMLGLYPLMNWLWPDGWAWEPRQSEYEQMIAGVYATLGLFLFLAAKEPARHASLIQFAIWSSVVHATIMALQAGHDHAEHANLYGDVPGLFVLAAVLWWLRPRAVAPAAHAL